MKNPIHTQIVNCCLSWYLMTYVHAVNVVDFTLLNGTLSHNMCGFAVGVINGEITTIAGREIGDNSIISSFSKDLELLNTNFIPWLEFNDVNPPFDAAHIDFYQSYIFDENIIYGIPRYTTQTSAGKYNKLFLYNMSNQQYIDSNAYNDSLPVTTFQPCIVKAYDNIYIFGGKIRPGRFDSFYNTTRCYDIKQHRFTLKADLPIRSYQQGCSIDTNNTYNAQYIYVFGGNSAPNSTNSTLDAIQKYFINDNTWVVLNDTMNVARSEASCKFGANYIYCSGGKYGTLATNNVLNSVELFDPLYDVMLTQMIYMNVARTTHGMVIINGNIFIFGGRANQSAILDSIETFKIERITPTPTLNPTEDEKSIGIVVIIITFVVSILIVTGIAVYLKWKKRQREQPLLNPHARDVEYDARNIEMIENEDGVSLSAASSDNVSCVISK
eukprot:448517_1